MRVEASGDPEKEREEEQKERKQEDRRTGSPLYNWRSTLKLVRPTDRLHPAGTGREG